MRTSTQNKSRLNLPVSQIVSRKVLFDAVYFILFGQYENTQYIRNLHGTWLLRNTYTHLKDHNINTFHFKYLHNTQYYVRADICRMTGCQPGLGLRVPAFIKHNFEQWLTSTSGPPSSQRGEAAEVNAEKPPRQNATLAHTHEYTRWPNSIKYG